jgi:hypothetical protein
VLFFLALLLALPNSKWSAPDLPMLDHERINAVLDANVIGVGFPFLECDILMNE